VRLTVAELELVAGGVGTTMTSITVTGHPTTWFPGGGWGGGTGGGGGGGGSGGGGSGGGGDGSEPPCYASNPASIESIDGTKYKGLDGAKYYVPQGIDNNYINNVANHIADVRNNGYPGQIYNELYSMYTDTSNPYFIDFKEYGTSSMPETPYAGTQTYYSEAAGQWIETSYFEPYGNVVYGLMMTIAGYSPEETWAVAAVMQEGHAGIGIPRDDPQDIPHVNLGISIGQQYLDSNQSYSPVNIDSSAC